MAGPRTPLVFAGLGLGALAAGMYLRGRAREHAVADLAPTLAGLTDVPFRVRRWSPIVAKVAVETAPLGVDPLRWARLLFGILDRESLGGDALRPAGPAGTGDWSVRAASSKRLASGAIAVQAAPAGWSVPMRRRADGVFERLPPPYAIPPDWLGWGRGLMQLDWGRQPFARTGAWQDPTENIRAGAKVLASNYSSLRTLLAGLGSQGQSAAQIDALRSAVSAYNAGVGAARDAILAGRDTDSATTGGDYARDVLRRAGLA